MSTILLSFEAEPFSRLESGEKKFEYRKHFPLGDTIAYFYVSKPVKAITGIAYFGNRERLSDWAQKYSDRPSSVQNRIQDYLLECNYAVPLLRFQKTNQIPLEKLRADLRGFVVPRMYYYIDDHPLLKYLGDNISLEGNPIIHTFETIADSDIC